MSGGFPVRALFLSDIHLGYKGADAAAVVECLTSLKPKTIYLVGDIFDGWKLEKRWHWTLASTAVIDALVEHRAHGVRIVYLPGNHDEKVRKINPIERARFAFHLGIRICNSCVHRTRDGKRIIVLHGDQFDNALVRGKLSRLSDWFYDMLGDVFYFVRPAPQVMLKGRLRPYSLAKMLMKKSGRAALRLLNNFQRMVLRLILRKQADGLICGHTHVPIIKTLKKKYIYANCGMWMGQTNTALIETLEGELKILNYPDRRTFGETISGSEAVHAARFVETAFIIRAVRHLWQGRKPTEAPEGQIPASDQLDENNSLNPSKMNIAGDRAA